MKTRTINELGQALCMCSEEDRRLLEENKEKGHFLDIDGNWRRMNGAKTVLSDGCIYKLEIQEPETRREWLATLPNQIHYLAIDRIVAAGNSKHLDDACVSLEMALGLYKKSDVFDWCDSPEGYQFWLDLANGKLPPIPQAEPKLIPYEQADYDDVVKVKLKNGTRRFTIAETSEYYLWFWGCDTVYSYEDMAERYEHLDGRPLLKQQTELGGGE